MMISLIILIEQNALYVKRRRRYGDYCACTSNEENLFKKIFWKFVEKRKQLTN